MSDGPAHVFFYEVGIFSAGFFDKKKPGARRQRCAGCMAGGGPQPSVRLSKSVGGDLCRRAERRRRA